MTSWKLQVYTQWVRPTTDAKLINVRYQNSYTHIHVLVFRRILCILTLCTCCPLLFWPVHLSYGCLPSQGMFLHAHSLLVSFCLSCPQALFDLLQHTALSAAMMSILMAGSFPLPFSFSRWQTRHTSFPAACRPVEQGSFSFSSGAQYVHACIARFFDFFGARKPTCPRDGVHCACFGTLSRRVAVLNAKCVNYIIIALKELLLLIMYTTVIIMIWILKSRICMTYKCMSPINMLQNVARHMHVYRLTKKKFASLSNKFHHSDIISVVCSG